MIETAEEYQLVLELEKIMTECIKDKDFLSSVKTLFQRFYTEYENTAILIPCICGENRGVRIDNTGVLGVLCCVACGKTMQFGTISIKKEELENENIS